MSDWKADLDPEARGGRYLAWKEVARATGLSRTTAWRLQKRGEFPAPYVISPGRVGYRDDEVEAWRMSRGRSAARAGAGQRDPAAATAGRVSAGPSAPPDAAAETPPPRRRQPASPAAGGPSSPGSIEPAPPGRMSRRRPRSAPVITGQILFDF